MSSHARCRWKGGVGKTSWPVFEASVNVLIYAFKYSIAVQIMGWQNFAYKEAKVKYMSGRSGGGGVLAWRRQRELV